MGEKSECLILQCRRNLSRHVIHLILSTHWYSSKLHSTYRHLVSEYRAEAAKLSELGGGLKLLTVILSVLLKRLKQMERGNYELAFETDPFVCTYYIITNKTSPSGTIFNMIFF